MQKEGIFVAPELAKAATDLSAKGRHICRSGASEGGADDGRRRSRHAVKDNWAYPRGTAANSSWHYNVSIKSLAKYYQLYYQVWWAVKAVKEASDKIREKGKKYDDTKASAGDRKKDAQKQARREALADINKEREAICQYITAHFPDVEAAIGGQISIDIYEKGRNKAQVLDEIAGAISFFGDKMDKGGNDYPIAKRLQAEKRPHTLFKVNNPIETWNILKKIS